jgi:hypothetical protein
VVEESSTQSSTHHGGQEAEKDRMPALAGFPISQLSFHVGPQPMGRCHPYSV